MLAIKRRWKRAVRLSSCVVVSIVKSKSSISPKSCSACRKTALRARSHASVSLTVYSCGVTSRQSVVSTVAGRGKTEQGKRLAVNGLYGVFGVFALPERDFQPKAEQAMRGRCTALRQLGCHMKRLCKLVSFFYFCIDFSLGVHVRNTAFTVFITHAGDKGLAFTHRLIGGNQVISAAHIHKANDAVGNRYQIGDLLFLQRWFFSPYRSFLQSIFRAPDSAQSSCNHPFVPAAVPQCGPCPHCVAKAPSYTPQL